MNPSSVLHGWHKRCVVVMYCRRLQREIDILQRKIAAVRRQAATAQPGGAAAAGEDSLAVAAAAGDVWGADDRAGVSGRSRGTKTAIQRDKALASLGLHVVEEFPRDVLVDVVQVSCACRQLKRYGCDSIAYTMLLPCHAVAQRMWTH